MGRCNEMEFPKNQKGKWKFVAYDVQELDDGMYRMFIRVDVLVKYLMYDLTKKHFRRSSCQANG